MLNNQIFDSSILVVAHPDDEVLWFSSVIDKVDEILVCYLYFDSKPQLTKGRKLALIEYPIKRISSLKMHTAEIFYDVDWQNPILTRYGLKLTNWNNSSRRYKNNYQKLLTLLREKLIHYKNVFSHNPWGEYGHPEHVQVHNVVNELKEEVNFRMWYPNYLSNKSLKLMTQYLPCFDTETVTLETNNILAERIKNLYQKHQCWTWYDEWQWPIEESLIQDKSVQNGTKEYGKTLPLNLIGVEDPPQKRKRGSVLGKLLRKVHKK